MTIETRYPFAETKYERLKSNLSKHYTSLILPRLGIIFALMSQFFSSVMVLSSKLLEQDPDWAKPLDPFELILIRMTLTCLATVIYFLFNKQEGGGGSIFGAPNLRHLLFIRGTCGFIGLYTLYFSIQYISMSSSTVINFLNPVITLILAFLILNEKYTIYEGVGGLFSIIGVMLVVQPAFLFPNPEPSDNSGVESSDPHLRALGVIVALIGCCASAISNIALRSIGKRCDPVVSVQWLSIISMIGSFIGLVFSQNSGFQMITTFRQLSLFLLLGISGFLTQFLYACGIAIEKAGRIVMLSYFGMIYTIFWEYTLWNHAPSLLTWCGFLIVVISTACIIYLKPAETESELDDGIDLNDNNNLPLVEMDDEERAKYDVELNGFIIDDDDEDDETIAGSSLNSVKSKV